MKARFLSLAVAMAGCMVVLPAYASSASLKADGLTYTLTAFATPNPNVADFTLTVSGINGSSDTEGNRYGVFALAVSDPSGFAQITGVPTGFQLMPGGLGSGAGGGCDGQGNFVCFQNTQPITQSSLAADSTLSFDFSLTRSNFSASAAEDYQDDWKFSWDGGKSKNYGTSDFKSGYDHVSDGLTPDIAPTPHAAPEIDPASATAALTFLIGGLVVLGGRRRRP